MTHGQGEHSEPYHRMGSYLAQHNWQLFVWDLRGHGRSPGPRGYIQNFETYISDHQDFLQAIEKHELSVFKKPIGLAGHSLGGLITVRSLIERSQFPADFLVLSNPFFQLKLQVPFAKIELAKISRRHFPRLTLANEIDGEQCSSDPDVLEEYTVDPYRHGKISAEVFLGALDSIEIVDKRIQEINLPLLLLLSPQDQVIEPQKSLELFERWSHKNKILKGFDHSAHEIFNDRERDKAFDEILKFGGVFC